MPFSHVELPEVLLEENPAASSGALGARFAISPRNAFISRFLNGYCAFQRS